MTTRRFILFVAVVIASWTLPASLVGPGGVAQAQPTTTTTIDVVAGQPIVQDNFDDNKMGKLWKTYIEDPNCVVKETNKRLELSAKAPTKMPNTFAGYIGDGWWIDPKTDFSMKVDIFYDLVTMPGGWISFGLTPNRQAPREQYVSLGIGSANRGQTYWEEWRDGMDIRWDFTSRVKSLVTLYISYNAVEDVLYLSDYGYGSENVWQSVSGLVRGRWARKPLFVFLGETVDGVIIDPGHAYLDNFMIESGTLVKVYEPNKPGEPNNPNEPNEPDGLEKPDVAVQLFVQPSTIKRSGSTDSILVTATLPKGIRPSDVNSVEPLTLWPGGAKATKQSIFLWVTGKTIIFAWFDEAKLLKAVPNNGPVDLLFLGYLKDDRSFGGTYKVTIK
jgi:hypothetical protein